MKKLLIVWLALIVLSAVGFYNAGTASRGVAYVVLAVGFAKFGLIFWHFMEMKHAHSVWKAVMALYVVALAGAFFVFM